MDRNEYLAQYQTGQSDGGVDARQRNFRDLCEVEGAAHGTDSCFAADLHEFIGVLQRFFKTDTFYAVGCARGGRERKRGIGDVEGYDLEIRDFWQVIDI